MPKTAEYGLFEVAVDESMALLEIWLGLMAAREAVENLKAQLKEAKKAEESLAARYETESLRLLNKLIERKQE